MTDPQRARRARGDHYCKWDEKRGRWKARATVGYDGRGKRIYVTRFGTSQSAALRRLREALAERERGITRRSDRYTVAEAARDWLQFGLNGRDANTITAWRSVVENYVVPGLGATKVKELTARDVETWLHGMSAQVGRATLVKARQAVRRSLRRAVVHELVIRNVAEYVELPEGLPGRPSKSFTAAQADAILRGTRDHRMHAYIVVSLLTGARTEEMRALRWDQVELEPRAGVPPHIMVWRSVRRRGDTKTRKSRRTIALPQLCVEALRLQGVRQQQERAAAGQKWVEQGLVFTTKVGGPLDANNVRRDFRVALKSVGGITPEEWTPRELRHSFVSLLSDAGVPIEDISRLVGHAGTTVTELVYRHQIRPVVQGGAEVMDTLFGHGGSRAVDAQLDAQSHSPSGNDEPLAREEGP
jgi:integrase